MISFFFTFSPLLCQFVFPFLKFFRPPSHWSVGNSGNIFFLLRPFGFLRKALFRGVAKFSTPFFF